MSRRWIALFFIGILVMTGPDAMASKEGFRKIVSERLVSHVDFSSWLPESFKVSPDGRQVAYAVQSDEKWQVVVGRDHGKAYESIGGLMFSPDGMRVAYAAKAGRKTFVVFDGRDVELSG